MESKKEEWIESVLKVTDRIGTVDANPYLYEKIVQRIINRNSEKSKVKTALLKLAIGFSILLLLNIFSIRKYHGIKSKNASEFLNDDYENIFNDNYNY